MLRIVPVLMLAAGTALAQTPAEQASRRLEQGVEVDRLRDAAREARGAAHGEPRPTRPEVLQFEPQRRTLQPDVGRPEETSGSITDGTRNATGMGPNPQR